METPAEEWIRGQENSGFYIIENLQYSPDSEYFYDFWLLTRDLSDRDKRVLEYTMEDANFETYPKCCYETADLDNGPGLNFFDSYLNAQKAIAYRYIGYTREVDNFAADGPVTTKTMKYVQDSVNDGSDYSTASYYTRHVQESGYQYCRLRQYDFYGGRTDGYIIWEDGDLTR